MANHIERLNALQSVLYFYNRYSLLLIFQAMDAAGKDGAIRHVMSGVNPQGIQVFSFKHPSTGNSSTIFYGAPRVSYQNAVGSASSTDPIMSKC